MARLRGTGLVVPSDLAGAVTGLPDWVFMELARFYRLMSEGFIVDLLLQSSGGAAPRALVCGQPATFGEGGEDLPDLSGCLAMPEAGYYLVYVFQKQTRLGVGGCCPDGLETANML